MHCTGVRRCVKAPASLRARRRSSVRYARMPSGELVRERDPLCHARCHGGSSVPRDLPRGCHAGRCEPVCRFAWYRRPTSTSADGPGVGPSDDIVWPRPATVRAAYRARTRMDSGAPSSDRGRRQPSMRPLDPPCTGAFAPRSTLRRHLGPLEAMFQRGTGARVTCDAGWSSSAALVRCGARKTFGGASTLGRG